MTQFKFEGHFENTGVFNDITDESKYYKTEFSGELILVKNDIYQGEIYVNNEKRKIAGAYLFEQYESQKLIILTNHSPTGRFNLVHSLTKWDKTNSFEGKYSGFWGLFPTNIEFKENPALFNKQIKPLYFFHTNELNLSKK